MLNGVPTSLTGFSAILRKDRKSPANRHENPSNRNSYPFVSTPLPPNTSIQR